jgi:hypothetical protein
VFARGDAPGDETVMNSPQTVLVVGGTGRTGGRLLQQLALRGAYVRAIVRSAAKVPATLAQHPNVTLIEADLLALSDAELEQHVHGCDAAVSCLGHVMSLRGIFGPPFDLVTRAVRRLCRAVEATKPSSSVRFVVMTGVSVNHPGRPETVRGRGQRLCLALLRCAVPPARDNQAVAHFLHDTVGPASPHTPWVVVRPDSLLEGDVSTIEGHETLVSSLFAPRTSRMSNVARFLCDLATDPETFAAWQGKLPVVVDDATGAGAPSP